MKDATQNKWSPAMPDKVGLWKIRCLETNMAPDYVAVTRQGREFFVHDEHVGAQPIKHYHDGLTRLEWRFIA